MDRDGRDCDRKILRRPGAGSENGLRPATVGGGSPARRQRAYQDRPVGHCGILKIQYNDRGMHDCDKLVKFRRPATAGRGGPGP
jgi:hypothetical protein